MDNLALCRHAAFAMLLVCAAACGSGSSPHSDTRGAQFSDPPPSPNLDARAERGLAISPVHIDTSSMDAEQRRAVGIGSYLVNAASDCTGCHTAQAGFLAGGTPFALGNGQVVFSRNLTPDSSTGLQLNEWQFLDTLRTGRDRHHTGKMLLVMPWLYFRWMSEADLHAIYAYLRAIPPVTNAVPPDQKDAIPVPPAIEFPTDQPYTDGATTRDLHYNGDYFAPRRGLDISPLDVPASTTVGLGSYIVNATMGCAECHTSPDRTADQRQLNLSAWMTGGAVFTVPPPLQPVLHQLRSTSANLLGAQHGFFNESGDSWDRFRSIIQTQSHADESPPRPLAFPMIIIAGSLKNMLDDDLHAVYDYLKALPATTGASDVEHQEAALWCASDADCGGAPRTCAVATHECVGAPCKTDLDCGTCQTCSANACVAPAADSACLAQSR